MHDTPILIISACLSTVLFSYLFYNINHSIFDIFEPIQIKIERLDKESKSRLKVISYLLVVIIFIFLSKDTIDNITEGLIFGILLSFRDACFRETFIENTLKK